MLSDYFGNPVSTDSQSALDHYNQGVQLFLGANYGAVEAFEDSVEADPKFALGYVALARAQLMAGNIPAAKLTIEKAEAPAFKLSDRERSHIQATKLILSAKPVEARALVLDHVKDYPRDAMVAQLCSNVFGLIGFSGQTGREAELLAFTSSLMPHYGDDWWMMSMHALSLCETGQIEESVTLMERSLALNPRNANASHFKAHAQYEAGETAAGRAYLSQWMVDYDDRAVLHGHLSWHSALWALHDGDVETMWKAVDDGVAPGAAKGLPINILTDTAAILYRAQLAGVAVEAERWQSLSDYAAKFFPKTGQSFADMHAALSHAMAGNGDRLSQIANATNGFAGDMVRPVARAWSAIADGNWQEALDCLTQVMGKTERIGGSRAQRDLLELTYVNVLMKLGFSEEARRTLTTRRPVLAASPPLADFN